LSIGKTIRKLRIEQDLTGRALAEAVDVSPSMISKVEHDVSDPSYDLLRRIASALNTSLSHLVEPQRAHPEVLMGGYRDGRIAVVRPEERKVLHLPSSGLSYQILSPDLQGRMEVGWIEMEPGTIGKASLSDRAGEECVLVLEGTLNVYIQGERFILKEGDCITFDCRLSHRYANEGIEKTVMIYVAAPPVL
jgi:transcriptional regulator with XRE-family HTH domain